MLSTAGLLLTVPFPYSILASFALLVVVLSWLEFGSLPAVGFLRRLRPILHINPRVFAGGAVIFMVASGAALRERDLLHYAAAFLVTGTVLMGRYALSHPHERPDNKAASALRPSAAYPEIFALGVILLLLLAEINGRLLDVGFLDDISRHAEFILLVTGIVLIVWGASGDPFPFPRQPNRYWPLLVTVLLALTLRFGGLHFTIRHSVDEGVVVGGLYHVIYEDAGMVTPVSVYLYSTQVYSYVQWIIAELFGYTLLTFRAVNALVGALTVIPVYLIGEALFGRRFAAAAALIMATFPPHLQFSRIAMAHIVDPFFGAMAFAFMVRGFKHNRRIDWAIAGAALGLTQYFFEGGRLLFPPLYLLCIAVLFVTRFTLVRQRWRGILWSIGIAALVAFPVYYSIVVQGKPMFNRLEASGVGESYFQSLLSGGLTASELGDLLRRFLSPLLAYVQRPESGLYYGGSEPIMMRTLVPVFLMGAGFLAWRVRGVAWVVFVWIGVSALANGFVLDSFVYTRYIVVFPALVLALTTGAVIVLPALVPKRLGSLVYAGAVIVICGIQVSYYFNEHLPTFSQQIWYDHEYRDGIDAALRAAELPGPLDAYILDTPANDRIVARAMFAFMVRNMPEGAKNLEVFEADDFDEADILTLSDERHAAFFVSPDDLRIINLITESFDVKFAVPSAFPIPHDKMYMMFFAPAGSRIARVDPPAE